MPMIQTCSTREKISIHWYLISTWNISTWLKVNRLSLNIKRHTSYFSGSKEIINVIWKFKLMANRPSRKDEILWGCYGSKFKLERTCISYLRDSYQEYRHDCCKAKHFLNRDALLTLYNSFIYPYTTYCNQVWGCTYTTQLYLAKEIIRGHLWKMCFITQTFWNLRTSMFTWQVNLCFATITVMCLMFFKTFFVLNSYHVPCVKNNLGKWCIRYRGVIVWNSILNLKINPETSQAVFVKIIKGLHTQSLSLCV